MTRVQLLLDSLGLDAAHFERYVEWALSEQLVSELAREVGDRSYFNAPDALKSFRRLLEQRTGRRWSVEDLERLAEAVLTRLTKFYREDTDAFELLKLLLNKPHSCAQCGRKPPEVQLHIDHIVPVKLGGKSTTHNLQFLCAEHNLRKGANAEATPWLDLK